jgi:hypothetical protein
MSKARDLADSAQEINILDGKSFLDEDNLASDSATGIASQQSIKAYVDGITTTNITSTGALNSGSITSGFGNIDNGSSTITTTGAISGGSFVIGSADINENDLESIDGITAGTVSASKAVVVNTNKDITGFRNITATGTISGSLSGTLSGSLSSTTTATTQAESDDSTKVATTAYVTDKITTLIGGAPSTLNDLNELAAAINDDANYNSTLTTALATKLPLAGGTLTGNVTFGDNNKAIFGAGSDLQIYHDGSNSYINETADGDLLIRTNGSGIRLQKNDGQNMVKALTGGAVQLYHNNQDKLSTTSTGISVTGNIAVSGTVDGVDIAAFKTSFDNLSTDIVSDTTPQLGGALDVNGHSISFGDNEKARFGNADDLEIYHTGSASVIQDSGTGSLFLQGGSQIVLGNVGNSESYAIFNQDGAVQLRHNNAQKFTTTSTGIQVTGSITSGDNSGVIKEIGSDLSLVQGAVGLRVNDAASAISATTATANSDGAVDLGVSNIRFKDLHLSGNISVGGTVDGRDVASDGSKLDGIATSANNYSHPTGNGNNHVPSGGSSGQILGYSSAGTAQWITAGGGLPDQVNWGSPNQTYTSGSGSWSVPSSIGDDDFVTFYLVGGGAGGTVDGANNKGGGGGAATLFNVQKKYLPSSVSYSIGSGGAASTWYLGGGAGGTTTCTVSGRVMSALGGQNGNTHTQSRRAGYNLMISSGDTNLLGAESSSFGGGAVYWQHNGSVYSYIDSTGDERRHSVFGGGAGGFRYSNAQKSYGVSTYAGNGGSGGSTSSGANGATHGGGGGGAGGGVAGNGGTGSLRIYY